VYSLTDIRSKEVPCTRGVAKKPVTQLCLVVACTPCSVPLARTVVLEIVKPRPAIEFVGAGCLWEAISTF
jgi:hypothetical protein